MSIQLLYVVTSWLVMDVFQAWCACIAMGLGLLFLVKGFRTFRFAQTILKKKIPFPGTPVQRLLVSLELFLYIQVLAIPPFILIAGSFEILIWILILTPLVGCALWMFNQWLGPPEIFDKGPYFKVQDQ